MSAVIRAVHQLEAGDMSSGGASLFGAGMLLMVVLLVAAFWWTIRPYRLGYRAAQIAIITGGIFSLIGSLVALWDPVNYRFSVESMLQDRGIAAELELLEAAANPSLLSFGILLQSSGVVLLLYLACLLHDYYIKRGWYVKPARPIATDNQPKAPQSGPRIGAGGMPLNAD
ncbi:MAG: hypothetical protein KDA66_07445, partial [Planctomycetaceae bacterium]|nr:hypothetical protein [Planctomycetaceae bacterium]